MFTRKQRNKKGGALLGEGVTGRTLNVGCGPGGNSFCKEIEGSVDQIEKIIIFESTRNKVIKNKKEISQFIQFVHSLEKKIAKVIKEPPAFLKKSKEDIFFDELESNRKINSLYGNQASKFLTISPLKYKKLEIIGAQVFLSDNSSIYVIFGQKCQNKFKLQSSKKLNAWLIDILTSLTFLQNKKFLHNDIKPDNTVLCESTFTLIDWGFACPMNYQSLKKSDGDDMFISPIRWYMTGISKENSFDKLIQKTKRKNKALYNSQLWKSFFSYLKKEVDSTLSLNLSHQELFERFKYALDVMMIGFTIVEVVHDSHLSWNFWQPVVEKLVSHKEPMSAKDALEYIKSITNRSRSTRKSKGSKMSKTRRSKK